MPTVLTLAPVTSSSQAMGVPPGVLYPSLTTYPGATTFPGPLGLTLAPYTAAVLTLTPA